MAAAKNLGVLPYPLLEGEGNRTKDDAEYRFIGMKPDDCDCRGRNFV
jgi:hypothetical protein